MWRATRQAQLSNTELHQLKWLLGNALALIGIWSLLQLQFGLQGLIYLCLFGLIILLIIPKLAAIVMQSLGKALAPAVVLLVVIDFSLNFIQLMEPLTRMVLLLALLRTLQYRNQRQDLQLLLLALFMLILTGVLTLSLLFALQIILFSPLAMGLLFIVNLLDSTQQHTLSLEDWDDFQWRRFAPKIWSGLDLSMLLLAGTLFVSVVTVSSCIFILLPRFDMGQNLSFMQLQVAGKKGFSDRIQFGDVNDLADDNAVALRVEPPNRDSVPATPYMRMIVLDEYRNGTFSLSRSARSITASYMQATNTYNPNVNNSPVQPNEEESDNSWVFYLEGNVSRYLPLMGPFEVIRFPKETKITPFPALNLIELNRVNSNVFGYSIDGIIVEADIPASPTEILALQQAEPVIPAFDSEGKMLPVNYPLTTLLLPNNPEDRTYLNNVLAEITGGQSLDFVTFKQRVFSYLHNKYQYETSLGDLSDHGDTDPLLHWMRGAETGWCEHFAGAFILLARTAGFPARAVTGFTGATWNDFENYLVVRNSHAHAWVEVYDVTTSSWQRVDPTPVALSDGGQGEATLASGVSTDTGLDAWLDSLRMVWYRRVVNFDQADQEQIAKDIRDFGQAFVADLKKTLLSYWHALRAWFNQSWGWQKIMQLATVLVGIGLLLVGLRYWNRGIIFFWNIWYRRGVRGGVLHPTRRQAGKWLIRLRPIQLAAKNANDLDQQQKIEIYQIYQQLLALRYGESLAGVNAQSPFKQAKCVMKRYGK